MIIYFDGGCRPNPGRMAIGVVAEDGFEFFELRDQGTNNVAEWLALYEAACYGSNMAADPLILRGDSSLVVNQVQGKWKIKQREFLPLRDQVLAITAGMDVSFEYVPRAQNLAGHLIERKYKE